MWRKFERRGSGLDEIAKDFRQVFARVGSEGEAFAIELTASCPLREARNCLRGDLPRAHGYAHVFVPLATKSRVVMISPSRMKTT
jgi:hypothetical protein